MNFDLSGNVCLITGGSRGIGLETAQALLSEGAEVIICGRKKESLEKAGEELADGGRLTTLAAHIGKPDQVEQMFETIEARFGRLDVLVNNVGMNLVTPGIADLDPKMWHKIIDTNLDGTFFVSRRAAQIMRSQGRGKIVSISSVAAKRAAPGMGVYGIAKAGIEMMTKVLASELAMFNIQVNAVAPAMVRTAFSRPFWSDEALYEKIIAGIPAGRIAETDDVVKPVLFLASQGSSFITGQTLTVDGGATAV